MFPAVGGQRGPVSLVAMLRSAGSRQGCQSGIPALRIHNQSIKKRGAMFNRKKERTRKTLSVGIPAEALDGLKGFLLNHAEDPTGPTWSLGRFIGQAINEKIQRETEISSVEFSAPPATPVEGGSE